MQSSLRCNNEMGQRVRGLRPHRKKRGCCPGNGTWRNLFSNAPSKFVLNSWRAILITIATIVSSSFSSSAANGSSRDDFEGNFGGKVRETRWREGRFWPIRETNPLCTSPRRMKSTKLWRTIASSPLARRASATKAVGNSESDSSSYSCGWFPTSYILGFIFASVSPPPSSLDAEHLARPEN